MTVSIYLADELNDHVLQGAGSAWTAPSTVYAALFTAVTGLSSDNPTSELVGNGYLRQIATFGNSSGGTSLTTADITYPAATGSAWSNITHVAIVTHATATDWGTGVHVLYFGQLDTPRTVNVGQVFRFLTGDLDSVFTVV